MRKTGVGTLPVSVFLVSVVAVFGCKNEYIFQKLKAPQSLHVQQFAGLF